MIGRRMRVPSGTWGLPSIGWMSSQPRRRCSVRPSGYSRVQSLSLRPDLAWQADADQSFAGGEYDSAFSIVPSVAFVLAHHRELNAVDGEQFV